jgi:hypothetical protein
LVVAMSLVASSGLAMAQSSASYRLSEHVFNAGGHPAAGAIVGSASHRVSLDALGDSVSPGMLGSASNMLGGGFVTVYPPPSEVQQLRFSDKVTLFWNPELSTGSYNLYRGALTSLSGLGYGTCSGNTIPGATTTDPAPVASGQGFFYLVTAENLIAEEGIKGRASSGALRPNPAPCP